MKITYEVVVDVKKTRELDWVTWMTDHHMPSICRVASVSDAMLIKSDDQESPDYSRFRVLYLFNDKESVDDYLENHAKEFRAEHEAAFGGDYKVTRHLGILMKWLETRP